MKARVTFVGLIALLICLPVCLGNAQWQWWRNAADLQGAPSLIVPKAKTSQDFMPNASFVGEVNGLYIDPEFNDVTSQVVFQDFKNRVWIGDIAPVTGFFKTSTGHDYLVDENITIIFDRPPQGRKFSTNCPEWTWDAKGQPCVVYTKADENGILQQWIARLVNGKPVVTQLTRNRLDTYGNMPSRFMDGKPPRVAFLYGWPIWRAKAGWIFRR